MSDPVSVALGVGILTNLLWHPIATKLDSPAIKPIVDRIAFCRQDKRLVSEFVAATERAVVSLPPDQRRHVDFLRRNGLLEHNEGFELHKLFGAAERPDMAAVATICRELYPEAPANLDAILESFLVALEAELRTHPDFGQWITYRKIDDTHTQVGDIRAAVGRIERKLAERPAPKRRVCTLPASVADFTGRGVELARLAKVLGAGGRARILVVTGMGGVGKTALAVEAAWRAAESFPDGVVFLDLGGFGPSPLTPGTALANLIAQVEPTLKPLEGQAQLAAAYRSLLTGRRLLLLLDNARDLAQVQDLLPPEPVALLVTSRVPIRLPGVQPLALDALPDREAIELLRSELRGREADEAEFADLAAACARLPIALRAAGAFLAEHSSWSVAEYLAAAAKRRLPHMKSEDDPKLDVAVMLALSVDRLTEERPELAARWRLLSVFPGDFDSAGAAAVWTGEADEARLDLDRLVTRSLLLYDGNAGRWRLHDLYRELAEAGAEPAMMEFAQKRHATHYCGVLAQASAQYLARGLNALAGLKLFDLERPNIEVGHRWATSQPFENQTAARLMFEYTFQGAYILPLRISAYEQLEWLTCALTACRRYGQRKHECATLGNIGGALMALGQARRAAFYWNRQRHLSRILALPEREVNSLIGLGSSFSRTGKTKSATRALLAAFRLSRKRRDRAKEGMALTNLGVIYKNSGSLQSAFKCHRRRLSIALEQQDLSGEASARQNMGNVLALMDMFSAARVEHERALEISRILGDSTREFKALGGLADVCWRSGHYSDAIRYSTLQLEEARHAGDKHCEATALFCLALAHGDSGELSTAVTFARESLQIRRTIGDPNSAQVEAWLREHGMSA